MQQRRFCIIRVKVIFSAIEVTLICSDFGFWRRAKQHTYIYRLVKGILAWEPRRSVSGQGEGVSKQSAYEFASGPITCTSSYPPTFLFDPPWPRLGRSESLNLARPWLRWVARSNIDPSSRRFRPGDRLAGSVGGTAGPVEWMTSGGARRREG